MTKYVPIETIKYALSKIRKSSNFNYRKAIERNKRNQAKNPPLLNLINFLKNKNTPEKVIDKIVGEYWAEVEKDNRYEIDIAKKLKMKYVK
mgnify:CR=1 FL=1|jgi:hypothetical protein